MDAQQFRAALNGQLERARRQGRPHAEINAGELHRCVGGYPPAPEKNHAMPTCCAVMRDAMRSGLDDVVFETDSGNSASLTIRYALTS